MSDQKSALERLPAELRNLIYDFVIGSTEHVIIWEGKIRHHPLAHVSHQINEEFLPIFLDHRLWPDRVTLHVKDFDFESSVAILQDSINPCNAQFDVHFRVKKQLERSDWQRIWPWVHYWNSTATCNDNGSIPTRPQPKYIVKMEFGVCNIQAALHELYVEVVPFLLRGTAEQSGSSLGYREISAMKDALGLVTYH